MQNLGRALEMVCLTDSGLIREHNEDAVTIDPDYGFAILADGLGGYNAGEVASGMTVNLVAQGLRQALPHCAGMGTTIVRTLFFDNRLLIAHIGDSRCYRLRGEEFVCLTRDHSLLQEQIDLGLVTPEEARYADYKNLVTRALGIDDEAEPDFTEYTVEVGDIFLLCSDGLNDMVEDQEIADILDSLRVDLAIAAQQRVHAAGDHGGRDNGSVILIHVKAPFPAVQGWFPWLFSWFGQERR